MLDFRINKRIENNTTDFAGRRKWLLGFMLVGMLILAGRAIDLQVLNKQFLMEQGDNRHVARVGVSAYRGKILDRNGEPLAISTPVQSIWVNPQAFGEKAKDSKSIKNMAGVLGISETKVRNIVSPESGRRFAYLKRRANPSEASRIKAMKLPGVYFEREFKRYYPYGEVTSHLVGFTNIDDVGQEGLERNYESYLRGVPGSKRVIMDGKRRIIADVEEIQPPVSGKDLILSIDQRIQYSAYRELKASVMEHKAVSGALVVLDAKNGDVLAAVNQPSFNPNTRKNLKGNRYRNRAITDVFEPGSTVKPFVVGCALDEGVISRGYQTDTSPGWLRVGRNLVRDIHNYGKMDLTRILKKSSNVAVSEIALKMQPKTFWECYNRLGFGESAGVGFPGEATGNLLGYQNLRRFEQATLSFGYGLSTSVLQLARAYTVLADDGILHSVSLLKREEDYDGQRVMSAKTARKIREMLEQVVQKDGTAYKARVDGYRVAGKTGTVKKAAAGGYSSNRYFSVFVGMVPAENPRLVIVVIVDEPTEGDYYGGLVAGPVFSRVAGSALRTLGIAPDQEDTMPVLLAAGSKANDFDVK